MTTDERGEARFVVVGRVAAPFGVRGWLNVVAFTAAPQALLAFPEWRLTLRGEHEARAFRVVEGRIHGDGVVAQVEGIATREQAAGLRGAWVEVPREALAPAGEDEVYLADLPGCTVVNGRGVALGVVETVEQYGAQPLLRVVEGRTVRLIPLVPAYVRNVDLAARTIETDWEADY